METVPRGLRFSTWSVSYSVVTASKKLSYSVINFTPYAASILFSPVENGKINTKYYTWDLNFCKGGRWMKIDMARKSTDNLRSELMDAPDLTTFLAANEDNFSSASAVARLNEMLEKKGLSKAALAKQSGMSEIYLHQIFAGRRNPSRSRMLCLCFGLSASLEETQELLRLCGLAELYPKVRRDAIIIYGLLHGMDLFAVNDRLFSEDEETLF